MLILPEGPHCAADVHDQTDGDAEHQAVSRGASEGAAKRIFV
jgi:hypothetical protein